jgi:hypothetical protein
MALGEEKKGKNIVFPQRFISKAIIESDTAG